MGGLAEQLDLCHTPVKLASFGRRDFLTALDAGVLALLVRQPLGPLLPWAPGPFEIDWLLAWYPGGKPDEARAEIRWRLPGGEWVESRRCISPSEPVAWLNDALGLDFRRLFRQATV
jgi:hypothetical protein